MVGQRQVALAGRVTALPARRVWLTTAQTGIAGGLLAPDDLYLVAVQGCSTASDLNGAGVGRTCESIRGAFFGHGWPPRSDPPQSWGFPWGEVAMRRRAGRITMGW
jgi:hypothetical protein